jgi:uncharacterized membrane protein
MSDSLRLKAAIGVCAAAVLLALFMRWEAAQREISGAASTCRISDRWDCDVVQSSRWGKFGGVSMSTWGAAGYLILLVWLLAARRRPGLLPLAGAVAAFSLGVSAMMAYISAEQIGAFCLYCTILQVASLVVATLVVPPAYRDFVERRRAAPGFATLTAAIVIGLAFTGDAWAARRAELLGLYQPYEGKAVRIDVSDCMLLGDPDTPHSVLIYFSFGCPRCRACYDKSAQLVEKYPRQVHFLFKHWPLDMECNPELVQTGNPAACRAAHAGQAAALDGHSAEALKYFFDLARHREPFSRLAIDKFGRLLGYTAEAWRAKVESPRVTELVRRDIDEGNALHYVAIPVTYVDGRRINPARLEEYVERICR